MDVNSVSCNNANFKGNLVFVDKKGKKTMVPATEVKYIKEVSDNKVDVVTHIDKGWGDTFFRLKEIPYANVADLYKQALNSDKDIEIQTD